MSKAPDSPPRSRTRSRSRSRSYSRSQSRSRSRSRKRRYSSRSRSRSRSYSPSHRNYPSRDYQNNRGGFRPYNRGYRRPYYYRGRSRGYFPRGRYQNRGGGGGGNYGYRANNWQGGGGGGGGGGDRGGGGGGWHDQDHHSHSPRRGRSRSRSRTPRKHSGSRSRSRYSERSSSGRSRHSSYSSRSSSPRRRAGKGKPPKDPKDKDPRDKDKPAEGAAPEAVGAVVEGASIEKASGGKWISYDASPKQTSPRAGGKEDAEGKGPASGLWRTIGGSGSAPSSKSPTESESAASFGGFGFFSKEDAKVTSAFKKFLAENKGKKPPADKENGREKEQGVGERESEKSKAAALFTTTFENPKEEKASPFFDAGEEEFLKCHGLKDADEERADAKPKNTLTARDVFGKWGEEPGYAAAASSYAKEKGRRDNAEEDAEEEAEEEVYRARKHTSKKEEKSKKKKEKERARRSPSPLAVQPRSSTSKERPLFPAALAPKEDSTAPRLSASRADFELKMSALDEMPSALTKERHMPRDLAMPSKKEQEFRSIFQHIQSTQLLRNPTELFAQHIVAIVHYIKAQFFRSSDMSLSERFAMYQRKAAEVEMMKPRKSPEIHRRIDVSPSAFKRHSHLFEDMEASGYKDAGKKVKGDVMDLRLDIERRKRFAGKDRDYKRDGGKSSGGSRGPSRERSSEKSAKHHKKSKKSKKKRDRSPSSSSSSSSPSPYPPPFRSKDYMGEGAEPIEEGYHQRYPPRDYPGPPDRGPRDYEGHGMERGRGRGFFPRIRGRGWNRGNYPGNSNNGNPPVMNPPVRPPEEEWDPEYTPKSRKYYLHDDRDGEKTWLDNRGRGRGAFPPRRGRFVYRKGGGSSPKWTHDMYQGSEEGELADDGMEPEHKDKAGGDAPIPK